MRILRAFADGAAPLAFAAVVYAFAACSGSPKQDARTAVDVVRALCPDLSCVDAILADPNVQPEFKAKLRAGLGR